jgi:ornithine cyclodeaminase/alanine dehydrogenase-like protein (mu-crystallin family)
MRVINAEEIDALLDFPALIAALRTAFAGGMAAPERHHHTLTRPGASNATHLLMPAWTIGAGDAYVGTKIVNVFPDNGALGMPAVHGLYVLQSGLTGAPIAAMDGARLTLWRTAAASALAASYLARADSERLLMVGAGALAPFLIRAHCAARPIARVEVWSRRRASAEALAASLRATGLNVAAVDDLSAAVVCADVISCATLSQTPLIEGAWLRSGQHVDLVGAFTMSMREADDEALRQARSSPAPSSTSRSYRTSMPCARARPDG